MDIWSFLALLQLITVYFDCFKYRNYFAGFTGDHSEVHNEEEKYETEIKRPTTAITLDPILITLSCAKKFRRYVDAYQYAVGETLTQLYNSRHNRW